MNLRWFGSVATLATAAGLAAAGAPLPADSSPQAPLPAAVPILVNGQPAPAESVEAPKAPKTEVKPVSGTADGEKAAPAPVTPPAVLPAGVSTGGHSLDAPPAAGVSFGDAGHSAPRVRATAEYLLWRIRGGSVPAVLGQIPDREAGLQELPEGAITPTFGGGSLHFGTLNGVRVGLDVAVDAAGCWSIGGDYFQLEHATRGASFSTNALGSPALVPVFFDPHNDRETIILYGDPNNRTGSVDAVAASRLWGFEVDARRRLPLLFSDRLEFIVGYRHLGFSESLASSGVSTAIDTAPSAAHVVSYADQFGVHNDYDGGQVGLESEYQCRCLFLDVCGKIGLGNEHETYSANGVTNFGSTDPTMPSRQFNGGVLTQPSNIGNFTRNRVCFLGEVTVNGGVRLFDDHVKLFAGYTFIGLSKVLRVGDTIDGVDGRVVSSLHGTMRDLAVSFPTQRADDGRFWAQGLNLGLSLEY